MENRHLAGRFRFAGVSKMTQEGRSGMGKIPGG
jgi:hypothetical protein